MDQTHDLTIRILQPEDAESYIALRLEALQQNPEAFLTTYEEMRQDPNMLETWRARLKPTADLFTVGTFMGRSLIGVATLRRESHLKLRHKASLVGVYFTPAQRGRGSAKMLISHLIEIARKQEGLEQIHLTVASDNLPAVSLYAALGFTRFGTEKNALKYDGVYQDEDYMTLFL
ncbi:GNAT family N-acetyltransferase [Brevibacillus ruminantium]|uniref:GNAT family N-acetyltransferase n=1 Tax=Brevibacillus ruminantium TaxID=2950604 RepID=A0ABY4WNN1_9BACL|nr:GNAT family protein [Brevibacillus ruminantium]USG66251.1 GNAT family N-acetyltransferase [Brevibacillus ruminantium]